jgi:Zn-dependent protease
VFALITAVMTTQFSVTLSLLNRIMLGLGVSVMFFAAVIIRELVISVSAYRGEIPIKKIVLFPFGGVYPVSEKRNKSTHPKLLYLARYLSNLVITAIFYGIYATLIYAGNLTVAGLVQWLTYIYFLLFLLHFVPALPLDGGEILRWILWKVNGDFYKATRTASLIGLVTGIALIFSGVLVLIISQEWLVGLLIVLIGWIIQIASQSIRSQVNIHTILRNIKVEDVMTRDYPVMGGQVNIRQLLRDHILRNGWHYITVVDDGKLKGILTIDQIKSLPANRWNTTNIADIMTPSELIVTAHSLQTADTLYEEMYHRNLDFIPVLENNTMIGVVSLSALTNLIKVRSGFGV